MGGHHRECIHLNSGHFALEEDGDIIAQHMRQFLTKHVIQT